VSGFEWANALEASALGEWMRTSALAYPIANVVHLLGLALLIAPIVLLDLRLLGRAKHFELAAVSDLLTPWTVSGFLLLAFAGFLMFSADAGPLSVNRVMQLKVLGIALGVANALLFRLLWGQRLTDWDLRPPLLGRVQAVLSILIWLSVGTLGRWIAYA
jgi:hypothetical protein